MLGGARPSDEQAWQAAKESYEKRPRAQIDDEFQLLVNSDTVKLYLNAADTPKPSMLLTVRGTEPSSRDDLQADFLLARNRLTTSRRWREDLDIVQSLVDAFPPSEFEWWGAGHSLGGAELLELQRRYPFIQGLTLFNSAFQPRAIVQQQPENKFFYAAEDPLYRAGGALMLNKVVVQADPYDKDDVMGWGMTAARAHRLDTFRPMF